MKQTNKERKKRSETTDVQTALIGLYANVLRLLSRSMYLSVSCSTAEGRGCGWEVGKGENAVCICICVFALHARYVMLFLFACVLYLCPQEPLLHLEGLSVQ